MEFISCNKGTFRVIDYRDYIANNLSEFGCAIFPEDDYENFDFDRLTNYLKEKGNIDSVALQVGDNGDKKLHIFHAYINCDGKMSSFGFFDKIKLACTTFGLNRFYACDFQSDKIFEMTLTSINDYGRLKDFRKLLNLNASRNLCVRHMTWCAPPGWKYLNEAKVFRNEVDKEYYNQYGKKTFPIDIFYSMEQCAYKLNTTTNRLEFDRPAILEFDIDDPNISIKATLLKARNLNIKSLKATDEVFCGYLKCIEVETEKIYAESIECKRYTAEEIRTNFKYGIKLNQNARQKEKLINFSAIIAQVKSFGGGYQEVLAQFVEYGADKQKKVVAEERELFVFGLQKKHEEILKREYDLTDVMVTEKALTIEELKNFFIERRKEYANLEIELWHIERPRAAYSHTEKDVRMTKIYDKQIGEENGF